VINSDTLTKLIIVDASEGAPSDFLELVRVVCEAFVEG
jgi:hypothetical protein